MMKSIYSQMMKNKIIWLPVCLVGFCFLVGIILLLRINTVYTPVYRPAQPQWPFLSSKTLHEINSSNLKSLQQISTFGQTGNGSVLKVALSLDGCCVFAIYQNGLLQKWDVGKNTLAAQYQLGKTDPRAVNFSTDGSRVVTPRQVLDNGKILGATVWNTATGKNIFCEGSAAECPVGHRWDEQNGFLLDPSGKWLLGYSLRENEYYDFQFSDLATENIEDPSIYLANDIYLDEHKYAHDPNAEVAMIATDIDTQYLAYAFSNGLVYVETANYNFGPLRLPYRFDYTEEIEKTKVHVVDLAIDDTRNWLVELRDDELLVWNLQRGFLFPLILRAPISNGTTIAFDNAGQILAVGMGNEIRFYDLNWGTVVGSIQTQNTSALTFSRDSRMLISGDASGNVRVWGIPK